MEFCRVRTFTLVGLMLAFFGAVASAQVSVSVAWNANTEPDVTRYVVEWGTRPGTPTSTRDVGNVTQATITGLTVDQRYYFAVRACNSDGLCSARSNEVSNNALITYSNGTLADQRPSIFWHNQETGNILTWHMNGTTVVDTRALSIAGVSDTNWKIVGIGDLNGDDHADLVWRHTDGSMAAWLLRYNSVIGTQMFSINKVTDPDWRLAGVGDVDGDSCADLVWQHSDGGLAVWFLRGGTVLSTVMLPYNVGPNSPWQIAAVGDVNKDGYADIVFQTTDAWLAVWLLRGGSVLSTKYLSIPQMPDANWRIKSVASPDASGHASLVWRHSVSGQTALWYLEGAVVMGTRVTTPSVVDNLDWTIVGSR
jgi:hypothetical protein